MAKYIFRPYWIAVGTSLLIFSSLYIAFPGLRASFTQEDRFLENLATILFFLTALLGLFFVWKVRKKAAWKIYSLIPALGLISFLEEVSFGERLFKFKPPEVNGAEVDGIHDMLGLAKGAFVDFLYRAMPQIQGNAAARLSIKIAGLLLVVSLLAIGCLIFKRYIVHAQQFVEKYPPFKFVVFAVVFVVIASFIDIASEAETAIFIEEICEMNAALALLYATFAIEKVPKMSPVLKPE